MAVLDLTGSIFGAVTVLERNPTNTKHGKTRWDCRCDCGVYFTAIGNNLRSGGTRNCGCIRPVTLRAHNLVAKVKHGLSGTFWYLIYQGARSRCTNSNIENHESYGGRGIEFRFTSLEQFVAELGERPSPQHSVDRIDNDGHYEPGNVRWATKSQQARNRRPRRRKCVNG